MNSANRRTHTLAVAMLLAIVTGVLAFGRRETSRAGAADSGSASGIVLRHPLVLSVDGPLRGARRRAASHPGQAKPTVGARPLVPIPPERQLVALPPPEAPRAAPTQAIRSSVAASGLTTRTHRIVEGDSLEQLAERYLGSRERSVQLFEANRHILTHPDVLPLGKRIVIPVARPRPVSHPPQTLDRAESRPVVPLN